MNPQAVLNPANDASEEKYEEMSDSSHPNANGADLKHMQTSGSVVLTPEMFERMYLGPQTKVKGDLRAKFGNPTPIGLAGFLMAYCPLIITFLGWRGATGLDAANVGTFYFLGGLLAILAGIGEWIIGNSFPSTFFMTFGGWFLYYGATLTPFFAAAAAYGPMAQESPGFLATIAYVSIFMTIFSFYCAICSLRINVLFVIVFILLTVAFALNAAADFKGASGDTAAYSRYQLATGAVGFPVIVIGWYLELVLMLSTVDFPLSLPVGDLSTLIKSGTEVAKAKKEKRAMAANGA